MSLSKQLGLGFVLVLILVFGCSLWVNVTNTRSFIEHQLSLHAHDSASSIGLTILPYIEGESDLPSVKQSLSEFFDKGQYESIVYIDTIQSALLTKSRSSSSPVIPEWFEYLFPISVSEGNYKMYQGELLIGEVKVVLDSRDGYIQLWENFKFIVIFLATLLITGLIAIVVFVKLVTKPIARIVKAADKISKHDYSLIREIPSTKELKLLVLSINKMATSLSQQHEELSSRAENYYRSAYIDSFTGLGNKLAFENHLSLIFSKQENEKFGYLILVKLSSLNYVNDAEGAQIADNYIQTVSQQLLKFAYPTESKLFRVKGGEFAIFLDSGTEFQCISVLRNLSAKLQEKSLPCYINGCTYMGAAEYTSSSSRGEVLKSADSSLTYASSLSERWALANTNANATSHKDWRHILSKLVEDKSCTIYSQKICNFSGTSLYEECFARFYSEEEGDYLSTSQLVAESEKLRFSQAVDLLVIESVIEIYRRNPKPFAVNISSVTMSDKKALETIYSMLSDYADICKWITLEFNEKCLIQSPLNCIWLAHNIHELGGKITVERVGNSLATLTTLRNLAPNYIKIDGSYTRNIEFSKDNQFFVRSLVSIAHGLDIEVIAELVESEEAANTLKGLFVDYIQGYFVEKPEQV